jgi:hypothetical protein
VSSAAQERVRIAPSSPGLAARPVQFAAKEGFFAREGLTPEIIVMRTNTGVAALVTGSIDFTTAGGSAMRAAVNGAPLKMVLNVTKKSDLWIVAQKHILRVEDLRGKIIGVGGNWGTQFYMVLEALKHYGADKDVQLVSTGDVANGFLSLQQGSMPAVALTPPYSILAQRQGFRDLIRTADIVGVAPTTGLVTTKEKLEREAQKIRRALRAVMKAVDYGRRRRPELVQFGDERMDLRCHYGDAQPELVAVRPGSADRAQPHCRTNTNQAPQPTGGRGRFFRGETDCPGAGKIVCAIPLLGPLAASTIPVFRALDLRYPTRFSPIVARIRLRRLADFAYIESTSAARFAPGGRM